MKALIFEGIAGEYLRILLKKYGNGNDFSASLRGGTTKQSLASVILSGVEGSVHWTTNRCFDYAQHDILEDCFVPRNDG